MLLLVLVHGRGTLRTWVAGMRRTLHAACNHFDRVPTRAGRPHQEATVAWRRGVSSDDSDGWTLPGCLPVTLPARNSGPSGPGQNERIPLPRLGCPVNGLTNPIAPHRDEPEPNQWPGRSEPHRSRPARRVDPDPFEVAVRRGSTDPSRWPDRHGTASCRSGEIGASTPGQAFVNTSASAASGSMPATILALILTALTALVAPVWRIMAMISSRTAR